MSLPLLDPGILFPVGLVVMLCVLGLVANVYGADTRPSESSDRGPSEPLGHNVGHHM